MEQNNQDKYIAVSPSGANAAYDADASNAVTTDVWYS